MSDAAAIQKAMDYLHQNKVRFQQELFAYLKIPSISAQQDHADDVRKAAEWTRDRCLAAGLSAEVVDTPGHPAVFAQGEQKPGRPTILIYGHFDVQPEGDLKLWHTGPFEPTLRDGMIICRGSADDKGQLLCAIIAVEAWMKTAGSLPVNVKFCIEGEEEIGSKNLKGLIEKHRERLACDYIVIHDTAQFGIGMPAVTIATRGLVYKEVIIRGPKKDLHSGTYGGGIANPANELAKLIASFHDADARVTIPGFYDDVREMASEELKIMSGLPFNEAAFLEDVGSPKTYGEKGYTVLQRRSARPTLDVNGIYGGYMKEGSSTIIPSFAGAKVSMRLVAEQDPEVIGRAFDEAVRKRVPDTVRVEILEHANCGAYLADQTSPGMTVARQAIEMGFGKAPILMREGGSLPILPMFKSLLGADSLMLGYCQPNCNAHSPNEFLHVSDFEAGARSSAALLGLMVNAKK